MDVHVALAPIASSPDMSTLISGAIGIIGTLLGSFVSVVATERFNRRTRARDDQRKRSASAFAIVHKLNLIYFNAKNMCDHIREGREKYEHESALLKSTPPEFDENGISIVRRMSVSMYFLPFANQPPRVDFTLDEVWQTPNLAG